MSLHQSKSNESIVISHEGLITEQVIIKKGEKIREYFKKDINLSRKVFSVYMELIQNIFYYSCEKREVNGNYYGIGKIEIVKNTRGFVIKSSNLAENKFVENIRSKIPIINNLNKEQLRKLKIETRRRPQEELSKGAGIGLIQLAILSGNPLNVFFEKKDKKYAYYHIQVSIY